MKNDLNHFNYIYDTNYRKEDMFLDLQNKKITDEGLKLICKIQFTKLKRLDLENNNLKDITTLSKSKTNLNELKYYISLILLY